MSDPDPLKVVCLWVVIEWRRPGVSLMEWELLGCLGLMAIMRVLKTMLYDQCLVTPHGKLQEQIWEYQETSWELTVPMERPT